MKVSLKGQAHKNEFNQIVILATTHQKTRTGCFSTDSTHSLTEKNPEYANEY